MSEIGIGIIGSGFMGRTYAECLTHYTEGARLCAVSGGSRAPALAHDYQVNHVPTVDELFKRENIHAVIITTPEVVHKSQTIIAASAGKHVLVEKPMAPDVTQCQKMIEACERAGVTLMVIQSQRFRGVHWRARELLEDGLIGKVRQLRHWGLQPHQKAMNLVQRSPFYLDPTGGGLFMGFTVHSFDLMRWLVGSEARLVFAHLASHEDIPDLSMMAQVIFEDDIVGQIWWSMEMPGVTLPNSSFRTQIVGTQGILDLDGYGKLSLGTTEGWKLVWEQPRLDPSNPKDPVRLESFTAMIQDFIDTIREGRTPSVTGDDGRAAVELCQAALMSAHFGKPITLPLKGDLKEL